MTHRTAPNLAITIAAPSSAGRRKASARLRLASLLDPSLLRASRAGARGRLAHSAAAARRRSGSSG